MRLPAWGTKADGRSRSSRLAAVVQTAARRIGHARPSPTESAETAPCWPKASERPWMVDIALRALAGRKSRTARSSEPDGIAGLRRADDKALSADRQSLRRRRARESGRRTNHPGHLRGARDRAADVGASGARGARHHTLAPSASARINASARGAAGFDEH